MRRSTQVFLLLVFRHFLGAQQVNVLSELPFAELLAQKKLLGGRSPGEGAPVTSASEGAPAARDADSRVLPHKKTFYDDDYPDDKGHVHKKKDEHKMQDVLNASITALSYLAFGGYLLCMIASALREKRRRVAMGYPPAASANNHLAHVLHHHVAHRPSRPFVRFPAVTVHQGGRKRRRRSSRREAPWT